MNKGLKVWLVLPVFVFLLNGICFANEPSDIVKQFYTADLKGARLSGDRYIEVDKYILWEDEPGWDSALIVDKVNICRAKFINKDECLVEVRYHVIGTDAGGDSFSSADYTEVINFLVVKQNNSWKIKQPVFLPHISPETAIEHTQSLLEASLDNDKERIPDLQRTIEVLKREIKVNKKNKSTMWFDGSDFKK